MIQGDPKKGSYLDHRKNHRFYATYKIHTRKQETAINLFHQDLKIHLDNAMIHARFEWK
jgi:hypothetical protein